MPQCTCISGYYGNQCTFNSANCSNTCLNNAKCLLDTNSNTGFKCACEPGFTGSHCERKQKLNEN